MCVIFIGHQLLADVPLLVWSNRDEFIDRPTDPLHLWGDEDLVAGRDRLKGGSWLAMQRKSGRFAAVTNVRQLQLPQQHQQDLPQQQYRQGNNNNNNNNSNGATTTTMTETNHTTTMTTHPNAVHSVTMGGNSRGRLVVDFCTCDEPIETYRETILEPMDALYDGYSLIYGSVEAGFYYYSNHPGFTPQKLQPGVLYGLSNGDLDAWPKVQRGKDLWNQLLEHVLSSPQNQSVDNNNNNSNSSSGGVGGGDIHNNNNVTDDDLFDILKDDWRPDDDDVLPNTGVGIVTERFLSSIFIPSYFHNYGTVSSTVVRVDMDGMVKIMERTFRHDEESEYTYMAEQSFRLQPFAPQPPLLHQQHH